MCDESHQEGKGRWKRLTKDTPPSLPPAPPPSTELGGAEGFKIYVVIPNFDAKLLLRGR
jgi:hypothetical protein